MWKPDTVLILGVDRLLDKLDEEIHNWEGNLPAAWRILRKNDIIPGDVDFVSKEIETFIVPTIVNATFSLLVVANLHKIEVLRLSIIIIINVDYYEFLIHCFLVGCFIRKKIL
jgi:hypothetical protein